MGTSYYEVFRTIKYSSFNISNVCSRYICRNIKQEVIFYVGTYYIM